MSETMVNIKKVSSEMGSNVHTLSKRSSSDPLGPVIKPISESATYSYAKIRVIY